MKYLTTALHRCSRLLSQELIMQLVVALLFFIVFVVLFYSVPRGIGFADESWFLTLLRDQSVLAGSSWPLFFPWLSHNNILVVRLVTLSLMLAGNLVFAYGIYSFFKEKLNLSKHSTIALAMVGFIGVFCFIPPVCLVPYYAISNLFIFQVGIGFALLSATGGRLWAWASGFSLGFLMFIMPTNIPILLFAAMFFYTHQNRWQRLILFVIGIICAFIIYFVLVQSPSEFYAMVLQVIRESPGPAYGIKPMLFWSVDTIKYVMLRIVMLSLLVYFLRKRMDDVDDALDILKVVVLLLLVGYFANTYARGLIHGPKYGAYPAEIIAVLSGWLILETRHTFDRQEWMALLLVAIAPILASLGSAVPFSVRGTAYMGTFYGVISLILVLSPYCARFRLQMCLVLMLVTFGFVIGFFRPNWSSGESLSKNNIPILNINKEIRISQKMSIRINEVKDFIGVSGSVALSDPRLWGFIYLLDLKPMAYEFRPNEVYLMRGINKLTKNELIIIESREKPFSELFWFEINSAWKIKNMRQFDDGLKIYCLIRSALR
jgi:hypothetical protein